MTLNELRAFRLVYLASPYSRLKNQEGGLERACADVCVVAGDLLRHEIKVFSPIGHSHVIAKYAGIDPLDYDIWLDLDEAMMEVSDALVIAKLKGWERSEGVDYEKDVFFTAGKPVYELDPKTLEIVECLV